MTRAAIYIRVSTEEQAKEGFSLDAQKERLVAYCEAQGWEVSGIYCDNGHSGRNIRRPAYQKMLEERDKWDVVLVMKMDRIHRNSKNFMIMMEMLEKWGKKFASMQESFDTSNAIGRFVVDIIQRIAQLESEQIGERTYMGMAQKAESGTGILGFYPPFGYKYENGQLLVVDEEAGIVLDIFQSYLRGERMKDIAWRLNKNEIFTRRGKKWTVWSISRILKNPIYAGFLRWDGRLIKGAHVAIVPISIYNAVQETITSRARNRTKRKQACVLS